MKTLIALLLLSLPVAGAPIIQNPITTNALPIKVGFSNTRFDSSTNVTILDGVNSTFTNSPNSVFGWELNTTVTNSTGLVNLYSRESISHGEFYDGEPLFKNSDHSFLPYIIGCTISNASRSALSWAENSSLIGGGIYGTAVYGSLIQNNVTFQFGTIGVGSEAIKNSVGAIHLAYSGSAIDTNSIFNYGLLYGGAYNNNHETVIGESRDGTFIYNKNVFVGMSAYENQDGQIKSNAFLSILEVHEAHGASEISYLTNALVFGSSLLPGGQLRLVDILNGGWQFSARGDNFGDNGMLMFSFSSNGVAANLQNSSNFPASKLTGVAPVSSFNNAVTNNETRSITYSNALTVAGNIQANSYSLISNNIPTVAVVTNGAGVGATASLLIPTGFKPCDHRFIVRLIGGTAAVLNLPVFTVTYGTAMTDLNFPNFNLINRSNSVAPGIGSVEAHVDETTVTTSGFTMVISTTASIAAVTNDFYFFIFGQ